MAWITPKTNWSKKDYFKIADYDRIKGNLEYLATYLGNDYDVSFTSMADTPSSASTIFDASKLNLIPSNVNSLNQTSYQISTITNKEYIGNTYAPNYTEWNRVEGAIFTLYKTHKSKKDMLPHLAWTMGGAKAFGKRVGGN